MMQQPDKPDPAEVLPGPANAEERNHCGPPTSWRRRSPRGRAVIAATAVAVLALGGTVAYAAASDGSGGGRRIAVRVLLHGPGSGTATAARGSASAATRPTARRP